MCEQMRAHTHRAVLARCMYVWKRLHHTHAYERSVYERCVQMRCWHLVKRMWCVWTSKARREETMVRGMYDV